MMKQNPLGTLLGVLLLICVSATGFLAYFAIASSRKLHGLQFHVAQINQQRGRIQTMALEAIEYSKKNPSIDPILQSTKIKSAAPESGSRPNPGRR